VDGWSVDRYPVKELGGGCGGEEERNIVDEKFSAVVGKNAGSLKV
jgi:hypothetical protein